MFDIILKAYSDSSRKFVRRMFLDDSTSLNFIHNITFTSLEAFDRWFNDRVNYSYRDFYIVNDTKEDIGIVYSYAYDDVAQHLKVTIALAPEKCGYGVGASVIINYLKKIFETTNLNKVFSEIYSFNKESLESTCKFGFETEGIIKDYKLFDGRYYDLHVLSMTREKFYQIIKGVTYEKLCKLCGPIFE